MAVKLPSAKVTVPVGGVSRRAGLGVVGVEVAVPPIEKLTVSAPLESLRVNV